MRNCAYYKGLLYTNNRWADIFNHMVEYSLQLDSVFSALADGTRRDILARLSSQKLTISELAKPYKLTFSAIAKHLSVLEKAGLVRKKKRGREQVVQLVPGAIENAESCLQFYRIFREQQMDKLARIVEENH